MNQPQHKPRYCEFTNGAFERREGEIMRQNGNLTEVYDRETGTIHYLAPHEIEKVW